jgi:hypothetical protein
VAEPLERQVILDISPALGGLRELDDAFEQFFASLEQRFSQALAAGTGDLEPVELEVDADTSGATDEIDALGGDTVELDVDADIAGAEDDISGLSDQTVELATEADISGAEADISELEGTPVVVPVEMDTGGAQEQLNELGDAGEGATGGLNILGGATAGLTQKFTAAGGGAGAVSGGIAKLGPAGIAAAGGIAITVGGLSKLVTVGTDVIEVTDQFEDTFGAFADEVRQIDVAGLNTSLDDLSISLGTDDEALLAATTRAGAFAKTLGLSAEETAKFGENVVALGAFVSSVNPSLGDIDVVVGQIARTLSRSPHRRDRRAARQGPRGAQPR